MGNRIIVCGGNGAGKSTLGRSLAKELHYQFRDIEDYYFPRKNTDYTYASPRTEAEVRSLLLEDLKRYPDFIFASVRGNYGDEIASMFTCAIYLSVPKDVRIQRVKERSYQKFGDRMKPGGDLYEAEKRFFDMVEGRTGLETEEWLESAHIPTIRVDGTQSIAYNTKLVMSALLDRQDMIGLNH